MSSYYEEWLAANKRIAELEAQLSTLKSIESSLKEHVAELEAALVMRNVELLEYNTRAEQAEAARDAMMDEMYKRLEQAEAALEQARIREEQTEFVLKQEQDAHARTLAELVDGAGEVVALRGEIDEYEAALAKEQAYQRTYRKQAEAEVERLNKMLRLAAIRKYRRKSHQDEWLADLRARAEEEK
jgi:hypothetical protein